QRLGSMEGEDVATLRTWIELICELRFDPRGLVRERQRFPPFRIDVEQILAVFAGLFFYADQRMALRLCFDGADSFSIDEEEVVGFVATFQQAFGDRYAAPRAQVDLRAALDRPTARGKQFIDVLACEFLRGRHGRRGE